MTKRAQIQGFNIDLISFDDAIMTSKNAIERANNIQVVTINPEMIQCAKKNPEFKKLLDDVELVIPDGVGIKYALRFKGIIQEQIPGIDFAKKLLELAAVSGYKVALIGAKPDVNAKAAENIKNRYPGINIVYTKDGYFEDENTVLDEIRAICPQVVLCALGAPKQEFFINKLKHSLKGSVLVGVGGTFDVIAGCVKLAPPVFRKLGLEWLYRTIVEPKRFKRIFPTLPIFFFQSIIEAVSLGRSSNNDN